MRSLLAAIVLFMGCATRPSTAGVAYVNGKWFDGETFVARNVYVVDGTFQTHPPNTIVATVDLQGKFVVPPLAEAHNHWLEPDRIDEYIRRYLADGVFYVMDQANVPQIAERVRAKTNTPDSIDYRVAILAFAAPGGHPIQIVKQFAAMGAMPKSWSDDATIDRNALLIVSSEKDVDDRWPALVAARPDFVKIFLEFSEEYEQRRSDPAFLYRRGLDSKLVPYIVRRAHAAGLRVSAHIYSATDFRNALAGGVDLIAHFPGTGAGEEKDTARFLITEEDARLAAQHHTPVITTLGWLNDLREEDATRADAIARTVIAPNLEKLRRNGVQLLIGSDQFRKTPVEELFILSRFGVSSREILRIATMDTPRAIFPERRIGALRDGYEASFLVLAGDPIADLANIRKIERRVKQGNLKQAE